MAYIIEIIQWVLLQLLQEVCYEERIRGKFRGKIRCEGKN